MVAMECQRLVFEPYESESEVTIGQLKNRFEQLGVSAKKAL